MERSTEAVLPVVRPAAPARLQMRGGEILFSSAVLTAAVRKNPLRLSFLDARGNVLNRDDSLRGMSWCGSEFRIWKAMPEEEHYLGFGLKAGRAQKKFTHMAMWNSDIPGYRADTDPLYQSIPFFYGVRRGTAYGIYLDNSFRSSFDMGKGTRDSYSFGAEGGPAAYYFILGPRPADVLSRYADLTGRMNMPPLWALGYQQCRWSYPTEERVRAVARGFRTHRIPCDVLYLDIDYMDGYRVFTWNKTSFPDPARMTADLRKDGFRTAVILDPGIKVDTSYRTYRTGLAGGHFLRYPDGRIYTGRVWPGECAFPDFSSARARAWWGEQLGELVRAGIRGWWNDMNEPSVFDVPSKTVDLTVVHEDGGRLTSHERNHNLYGLEMTRATYEGVRALLPRERPFLLTRASFAGGQRYSAAWTGDNLATWEHLEMAVAMCLNLSISGQPFVGSDIGGFIGYPGGELFARWLQFGVFCPLMRAHSVINERDKEPWEYGESWTAINRETIRLRYRLLPYIYNAMREASVSGIPPMRPLLFDYPEDPEFLWSDDEFLFGPDLLVAPVLSPGLTQRTLRLPAGLWYDFWSGALYEGGRSVTVDAPQERIPVFVRAGAIIPTRRPVQHTGEDPAGPLTFTAYPGVLQSTRTYYEDDGLSTDHEQGAFLQRTVNLWTSSFASTLTFSPAEGSYRAPARALVAEFAGFPLPPRRVELNSLPLPPSPEGLDAVGRGWVHDPATQCVRVKLPDGPDLLRIRVLRTERPTTSSGSYR